jgi:hypothetical protein
MNKEKQIESQKNYGNYNMTIEEHEKVAKWLRTCAGFQYDINWANACETVAIKHEKVIKEFWNRVRTIEENLVKKYNH